MNVAFSCDAARAASRTADGVVLSTTEPTGPDAGNIGLLVTARGGTLQITALARTLVESPIPEGGCSYRVVGDAAGMTVQLNGIVVASLPTEALPNVDMLTTSVTTLPASGTPGLSVSLRVDDQFASSPTALKRVLIAVLALSLAVVGLLLALRDRRHGAERPRAWPGVRASISVDVVVVAVMSSWMFLAPSTDDDGYYAAMARNIRASGFVGNYYQLYDQNFTPFTWFYYVLGWWQQLAGDAPVVQRVLSLVFGLLTWLCVRRFSRHALQSWTDRYPRTRWIGPVVLAAAFLAWWLPQGIGVRPESIVALCGAMTLLAVSEAARRDSLLLGWTAFVTAGLGFAAHPTGFTALAPLIAGGPQLWRLIRDGHRPRLVFVRAAGVVSGFAIASLVAFADGSLRDFIRGQETFLGIQNQEGWTTEFVRYSFLLSDIAMGSYAKRIAVLVTIVALVWFIALVAATRAREVEVPVALKLAGWSSILTFLLLWFTPSKWTHHFGAISGVCGVFLGLMLVMAVPLVRELYAPRRVPFVIPLVAAASAVVALALAGSGPNIWPYTWLIGVRRPIEPPAVNVVDFGEPLWWVAALIVVVAAIALLGRGQAVRDRGHVLLRAVPVLVVAGLLINVGYLFGTFAQAAVRTTDTWSFWGANLSDPGASRCNAAQAVSVLDPFTAQALTPAVDTPQPPAPRNFVSGAGFPVGEPPVPGLGTGAAQQVWGSFISTGSSPERTTGEVTSGWYDLPRTSEEQRVVTLAAGTLSDGNTLTAVFGRRAGGGVVPVSSAPLSDDARDPAWRTLTLPDAPATADTVRLEAVDATGGIHGWLAFTAPSLASSTPLLDVLPSNGPVGIGWQIAFQFPCLRQPVVRDGITEPVSAAVLWGDGALNGLADATWQPSRGGLFAQVPRSGSVLQLAATLRGAAPDEPYLQVFVFNTKLRTGGYEVTRGGRTVPGWSTATS
ncbi:MAG: hypothetical protein JWP64_2498 [Pseudonocardia sp.]|nr:hypothetical protein [Pseudonocardia sp.]